LAVQRTLQTIGDQHEAMRLYRRQLIDANHWDYPEFPTDFEYRVRCTRYLEIKVMNVLVTCVSKLSVEDEELKSFEYLEDNELWKSQLMLVWIWDQVIDVAVRVEEEFQPRMFPFIETYTMNIKRDYPIFQHHFNAHEILTRIADDPEATGVLKCTGRFDIDVPELRRQYPSMNWTRATYSELVLNTDTPKTMEVMRFRQISVMQMIHQTTTTITYKVDIPVTKEDVLRHEEFAHSSVYRNMHALQQTLRNDSNINQDVALPSLNRRRTLDDEVAYPNVRRRQAPEGPIRPALYVNFQDEEEVSHLLS